MNFHREMTFFSIFWKRISARNHSLGNINNNFLPVQYSLKTPHFSILPKALIMDISTSDGLSWAAGSGISMLNSTWIRELRSFCIPWTRIFPTSERGQTPGTLALNPASSGKGLWPQKTLFPSGVTFQPISTAWIWKFQRFCLWHTLIQRAAGKGFKSSDPAQGSSFSSLVFPQFRKPREGEVENPKIGVDHTTRKTLS